MFEQFSRTQLLLGPEAMAVLARSRVAVFGIGGVGGYVVEALARSGVGALDLVDDDVVCASNLNRQIIATFDTIGRRKVEVMAERVASINPACQVQAHDCFYLPETAGRFDLAAYDYVVDAVDTVTAKLQLAQDAPAAGTPLISAMGTAGKLDPTAFTVADIFETSICPLARVMRKECRKRGIDRLKVVYSTEPPVRRAGEAAAVAPEEAGPHPPRRCGIPPSVAFVPSAAGLIMASEVVRDLCAL